jgi:hypothetical protein
LTIELKIQSKYKECTICKEGETRLAKVKYNFKAEGTLSFEIMVKLNIDCARGAHNELMAEKKIFNIMPIIIDISYASSTHMHDDS